MKAIHGGKSKNDKIDSKKIAVLLRSGTLPTAYVYPEAMRSTRDLLRRRNHLVHKRTELLAHIQNTNSQYNSYCRLVKCTRESGGKKSGPQNSKIGNAHLKWAFSEAACLFLRGNEPAQSYHDRLVNKHGKGKALSILAHKIGWAIYFMLKRKEPFNMDVFLARA